MKARGFSLIEIMFVMALIAAIVVGIVVFVGGQRASVMESKAETQVKMMEQMVERYQLMNGRYPTTEEGLDVVIARGTKPGDKERMLTDPWGQKLNYVHPGVKNPDGYDLFSSGADKTPRTDDDVGNWEKGK